jgi:hypothetical protein
MRFCWDFSLAYCSLWSWRLPYRYIDQSARIMYNTSNGFLWRVGDTSRYPELS